DGVTKFAASGGAVPGIDQHRFAAFGAESVMLTGAPRTGYSGDFALDTQGDVAFTSTFVACEDPANLVDCYRSGTPRSGLFLYADGQLSKLWIDGDSTPDGGTFRAFDGRVLLNNLRSIVFDAVVENPEGREQRQ